MSNPENANEGCVGPESEQAGKASACDGCPNQTVCASGKGAAADPAAAEVAESLKDVKHKILILSGKGGVGKSTFASQLAWSLAGHEKQVGVLDIDICGPSIPRMFGVESQNVHRSNIGWTPVFVTENLSVMSVGFMLNSRNDAIIWRGPRKNGLIKQFLTDVLYGELDFLLIDAPPGTSDEHISVVKYMDESRPDGAVIVTTPQEVALLDVRKEITFCKKVGLPILGVVENMSSFVCPGCNKESAIFAPLTGGAKKMCEELSVPFLGSIPLDPQLLACCEGGKSFVKEYPKSPATIAYRSIIDKLMSSTPELKKTFEEAVDVDSD